jgi:predicted ABC-type ATPase
MRVFAGPNGSGKSSIILKLLHTDVAPGIKLDFGIYVNADDIRKELIEKKFKFDGYQIIFNEAEFYNIVRDSGLLNDAFSFNRFKSCIIIDNSEIMINNAIISQVHDQAIDRIAQIIAHYLRIKLLSEQKKFSFETVFSHRSKLEIIKKAKEAGYKIYLYYVSTEDPMINVFRVKKVRVPQHGHDVDEKKITDRYYRSMELLYEAAQLCDRVYFFDNSAEGEETMFAHFKVNALGEKIWEKGSKEFYPKWFKKYYSSKIHRKNIS